MRQLLSTALVSLIFAAGCASKAKTDTAAPAKAPTATNVPSGKVAQPKAPVDPKKTGVLAGYQAKDTAASEGKTECTSGKEVRFLEVRKKDKGCELAYTKNDQEAVVSTSMNGTEHCDGSLTKIKDKLTAAGYTCK